MMRADTFVERRRHPRLPVKIGVNFQMNNQHRTERSQSLNIGAGGIAIRSVYEMKVDDQITICLFIPSEEKWDSLNFMNVFPEDECKNITIQSRVAWCAPFGDGMYVFGAEFLHIAHDDSEYLLGFLKEYKIPELKASPAE